LSQKKKSLTSVSKYIGDHVSLRAKVGVWAVVVVEAGIVTGVGAEGALMSEILVVESFPHWDRYDARILL
jgi:hypothetical protein